MSSHNDIEKDLHGPERQFAITSWAVKNRTTVIVLTILICIMGIRAYMVMPKVSFPEVVTPEVFIGTPYNSSSVVDIEKLITKPIEKELNTITGVDEIKSTSIPNYSIIDVKFNYDVTPTEALRKVKDAVDKAKSDLPNDLTQDPDIFDVNLSEIPIMTVNLSGKYTNDELRSFAEYLEDEIEAIDEISGVEIKGSLEREVKIDVDLPRMDALEVSFQDIENAVNWENMNMSAGEIVNDGFRRAVRVVGEFDNAEDMERIIVKVSCSSVGTPTLANSAM